MCSRIGKLTTRQTYQGTGKIMQEQFDKAGELLILRYAKHGVLCKYRQDAGVICIYLQVTSVLRLYSSRIATEYFPKEDSDFFFFFWT